MTPLEGQEAHVRPFPSLRVCLFTSMSFLVLVGCGDDDGGGGGGPCTPGTVVGCGVGLVCEEVPGGEPACFAPIEIRGRVFDALDDQGIAGATIVALGANDQARSATVESAIDGTYELPIAVARSADGAPIMDSVTLRVDADGYQTFPTAPRVALPIEISATTIAAADGADVVMTAATDVALLPLPGDTSALAEIRGEVQHDDAGGVLVIAEQGGVAVSTAVTGNEGDFVLFNVPPGQTTLRGYRAGLVVTPEDVDVPPAGLVGVVLGASSDGTSSVSGSVNIVNAPGGSSTSVILVVASTFEPNAARGQAPAGLRAGDISSAFLIEGVPPGRYVALAAFENDGLVRDPDTNIGGTELVYVDVPEGGGQVSLPESFKVTGALSTISPGAETLEVVRGVPTFVWADDSSEDGYDLRVFDAFGELTYEALGLPRVTGSATVEHTYAGPALVSGMIYQFRVLSWRERGGRTPISTTEDLRGVFQVE